MMPATPAAAWVWPMLDLREPSQSGCRRAVLAVGGEEGLGFDGVAEGGAGAVGFDGVDVGGGEAGVGEGLADDALLGGAVGGGEAVGGAVLVDGGAADDGEDGVAVAPGVGEPLEQEQSGALGPARCRRRAAAKDLQRPSGARPRWRLNSTNVAGVAMTVTPPARARSHSPLRSAWAARCRATSDDEQAVSTVTAGPSQAERVGDPAGGHAAGAAGGR